MAPSLPPLPAVVLLALLAVFGDAGSMEILSKSRLESCARDSGDGGGRLSCDRKIVIDMAVPSGTSGGEASLVAQVAGVQENDTQATKSIRDPPVITISKTATYALYALTYLDRDVAYKPEEKFVKTRKCEPDAGAEVVKECERLKDENGHIIQQTEPICCPCGPHRIHSSCGNLFNKMTKGKANTAHCLRFPGDWFHVFGIGTRSLGFSITVQVKKGSSISEVVVGPENKTVVSGDNFLRVQLVGDYAGYTSIPSFEDYYLVTPRKGAGSGQPQDLGDEYSKWMLLERVRFTLDGLECDKIGVGYEAYRNQPNFCSSPFGSCLGNQLSTFWEYDQGRINQNRQPLYVVKGRFQRINKHTNAGVHTFSVGVTEDLNSNLLVELSADDIEYIYQRSPAKIIDFQVSTFETLSQHGTANVTTKNIGKLESSYSLTLKCSSGISPVEEQTYTMKPDEVTVRSFKLYSSTDQAAIYRCEAILKASDFRELERAKCQFSIADTVYNNGAQIVGSSNDHKKGGIWGFFNPVIDFFTGRLCRTKCSSLFDFSCHIHYICIGWILMILLLIATLPTAAAVLWLLHQKGFFDPLYDWWEDLCGLEPHDDGARYPRHKKGPHHHHHHHRHPHHHGDHHHRHPHRHAHQQRRRHHHAPAGEAEVHRHRHVGPAAALGVQQKHREAGHKHHPAQGNAVDDGPSRPRGTEDAVEYWERRRRHERRHAEHGQHDHDRDRDRHYYSRSV